MDLVRGINRKIVSTDAPKECSLIIHLLLFCPAQVWRQDNPKWKWAPEEDDYILQRWAEDGAEAISIELGRSKGAVVSRWSNVVRPRMLELEAQKEETLKQAADQTAEGEES
eukprot:1193553-Prorocentrum_minimum.AAC.4